MSGVNEYLMPAPWGSIVLCEDNHELCEVRPSLIRVDMPTPAPEAESTCQPRRPKPSSSGCSASKTP